MTLAERLREALTQGRRRSPELIVGDSGVAAGIDARDHAAAVLVAITDRPEPGVLLTRRTETLRRHAGQVAFPGGRIDPGDADPTAAALREAQEEIGLSPDAVDVVGIADRYRTITGFDITPVVGVVPPDLPLVPHAAEVAALFEVPLAHLLAPENQVAQSAEWNGTQRHFYEIRWADERIWGATAAMIVNLGRRLGWPA